MIKVLKKAVNNQIYHELGERWYEASDDPVALLRAEAKVKNPWVSEVIREAFPAQSLHEIKVLDVGCGAGFLSNALSQEGYSVTGLDLSMSSLEIAKKYDSTQKVVYVSGDAYTLPFSNETFEVVACMDFLEHVEQPEKVIQEAARVLKKNGIFIFHTFNRNWFCGLIVIKGVEWLVKNVPKNMHVLRLFIKPKEMREYCGSAQLTVKKILGISPVLNRAFFKLAVSGEVAADFEFKISKTPKKNPALGYLGFAEK